MYGNDRIAGGSDNDTIFGQFGDDAIQGDGALLTLSGDMIYDIATSRLSADDYDGNGRDGDDYVEGGGGNDVIFGNLGQDDLIGGSSNLFGTANVDQRPDGSDVIYGGSGTRAGRNDLGDESFDGHARDADVILGDNGNIFRIVGVNGVAGNGYPTFQYDTWGVQKIVPRTIQYLEYAFGDANNPSLNDELHGEAGDDIIHGMAGHDVLFGDGQDDDLIGGAGNDRLFGGAGEDGILGDDGRIFTSRNGLTEPLHGILTPSEQESINLDGTLIGVLVNINGRLKKSVDLPVYFTGGHDIAYGGLGDDFIHGGAGDDALSGAEATEPWFITTAPAEQSPLSYNPETRMFADYLPGHSLAKIDGFLLNFEAATSGGAKIDDGMDNIFGNEGNDWLVGGTRNDRMFGGMGDDLLNADDNLDTNGGLNNVTDAPAFADADIAFAGGGYDVLIGNTGADRLIDWSKRFNTYVVPILTSSSSPNVASPTVIRDPTAPMVNLLDRLGVSGGADQDIDAEANAFHAELGLVTIEDDQIWRDQVYQGKDRDPAPSNLIQGIDTLGGYETLPAPAMLVRWTSPLTTSEAGTTQTAAVVLLSPPQSDVVVSVVSQNPAEVSVSSARLTFTPLNWNIPQPLVMTGVDDAVADGSQQVTVTLSIDTASSDAAWPAVPAQTLSVTNLDNEVSVSTITGPAAKTLSQRPVITWTTVPGAASYEVWISNFSTRKNPYLVGTSSSTSFTPGMDLGIGIFDVWVRAIMPNGTRWNWSTMYRFQIDTPVIVQPVTLVQQTYRPVIQWQPVPGAVRYDVWINNTSTGQSQVVRNMNVTGTQWTPATDLPISAYQFWVRGIDAGGRAAQWSALTNFRIAVPPTPTSPLTSTFNRTPTFQWTPVTGAVSYRLMLKNMNTGVTTYTVQDLPTASWTPPAALSDATWRWWVVAVGPGGMQGEWSQAVDFYVGGWAQFTTTAATLGTLPTLSWTPVSGAVRYELQVNRIEATQTAIVRESSLTGTSFTFATPLVTGGTYRAWVRAISSTGEAGPWSKPLQFVVAKLDPVDGNDVGTALQGDNWMLAEVLPPSEPRSPKSTSENAGQPAVTPDVADAAQTDVRSAERARHRSQQHQSPVRPVVAPLATPEELLDQLFSELSGNLLLESGE
jgi:Ca2+-binding RTX toxin-like protein